MTLKVFRTHTCWTQAAAALAAAALAGLDLIACSSAGSAMGGPLGPPGNVSTGCMPSYLDHAVTIGLDELANSAHNAVAIDRVTLGSPRRLRLAGVYAVPGRYTVGMWGTFPPPARQLVKGVQWARRRNAAGTSVMPGRWVNLVAGLEPTRKAMDASPGIVVWYHLGATHYELRTKLRILVPASPARCQP